MSIIKEEIWKDIIGYEGIYQVSNRGKVRSLDRRNSVGKWLIGRRMSTRKRRVGESFKIRIIIL